VSNNAIEQGAAQKGEGAHLFAPMGFLDDSWFHRSYWVYGKSFSGGHNGYYQAGKYAPSGRIIVHDDQNVYGYGREAQYFKWTTTMEHQLMKMPKDAPGVAPDLTLATKAGKQAAKQTAKNAPAAPAAGATPLVVTYPQTEKNNIAGKPFTLEIWALPDGKDGVLISHGGPQNGAGLVIEQGKVGFVINSNSTRARANAPAPLLEGWHHLVGVLEADQTMKLYVDGQIVAQAKSALIPAQPKQPLKLGGDGSNNLTGETLDASYTGMMDQFAIYTRALTGTEVQARLADPTAKTDKSLAQFSSFDKGDARDEAGQNHGVSGPGIETGKGRSGAALWFRRAPGAPAQVAGKGGKKAAKAVATTPSPANPAQPGQPAPAPAQKGTFVSNDWQRYVPIITRAMARPATRSS